MCKKFTRVVSPLAITFVRNSTLYQAVRNVTSRMYDRKKKKHFNILLLLIYLLNIFVLFFYSNNKMKVNVTCKIKLQTRSPKKKKKRPIYAFPVLLSLNLPKCTADKYIYEHFSISATICGKYCGLLF